MKPPRHRARPAKRTRDTALSPNVYHVDSWSAFLEYVRFKPRAILEVSCKEDWRDRIVKALGEAGLGHVKVQPFSAGDDQERGSAPLEVKVRLAPQSEADFMHRVGGRERDVIIALDHITDPRNLGAIARTAAYFGVRDIIAPERRQVLLTNASVATAQGAFALLDFTVVVNLGRTLEALKKEGYWVIGTDMDGEPVERFHGMYEKVVLVMGSEERGMAEQIRKKCDGIARIGGASQSLESLNVAVACGICLYELANPLANG